MQLLLFPVLGLVLGLAPFFSAAFAAEDPLREPAFQENFYGVKIRGSRSWIVAYYGTILLDLSGDRLLVFLAAAVSGGNGLSTPHHPDDEHAGRVAPAPGLDQPFGSPLRA